MGRLKKFLRNTHQVKPATSDKIGVPVLKEKVSNHLSPKVLLKRLQLPLNGTIKLNCDGGLILDTGCSKAENAPMEKLLEKLAEPSTKPRVEKLTPAPKGHSTILIQKVATGTVVRKLPAGAVVSTVPTSPPVTTNVPAVIKKLPSGTIIQKLPPTAVIKRIIKTPKPAKPAEPVRKEKLESTKKEKLEPVRKEKFEPVKKEKSEPAPKNEPVRPEKLVQIKTENRETKPSEAAKVPSMRGRKKKAIMNKKPIIVPKRKYKKRIQIENTPPPGDMTPVRISARLKNRKEKFNVHKMLRGAYADYVLPKKPKPRAPSVEKPPEKKKRDVKKVPPLPEKSLVDEHKLKILKIQMDFPVELGPEITVTRVKNSRTEAKPTPPPKEKEEGEPVTPEAKKSVSKVTQTYETVGKIKEAKTDKSDWTVGAIGNKPKAAEEATAAVVAETPKPKIIKRTMKPAAEATPPVGRDGASPPPSEAISRGKKTAKVTPLTQQARGGSASPVKAAPPVKRPFEDDDFEKYFITKTRICEHNDSLESDSEDEEGGGGGSQLSHFVNFSNDGKTFPVAPTPSLPKKPSAGDETTIYDLVQDISGELPAWNLHVLEDTNSFCIAHVARGPVGVPVMKKIIEIDGEYNGKVYVNQTLRNEFRGVYNSYESIRNLILALDKL